MAVEQGTSSERVLAARERYVARGIATPPIVVARAEGARVEDVEGRSYIDFAGGLGCQNTGHGFPPAVAAMHEQIDSYLHQCFMVGVYEPYVDVCQRLAELSPCRGTDQKSVLLNTGAEAVENAVKIARVATGRPAVVVFDRAFHGRSLLAMTMTSKVVPYKRGFGPFAPEVYRAPAPYPYRGVTTDDAIDALRHLFKGDVDPQSVACVVLEPVQGEGGFVVMPTSPGACRSSATSTASSTSTTRCNPGSAARGRSGRSSTTAWSRTCSSRASRSAEACRWRRSRAAPR